MNRPLPYREFRSDTMTRPNEKMRLAMAEADVGDDVCGEDPTVNRLQAVAADRMGKEAALFMPSGHFANQCAIRVHTQPGDEVIMAENAHVVEHEAGAAAALSGVQLRTLQPESAAWPVAEDIAQRIRIGRDLHWPSSRLIILENALSSGMVMPIEAMKRIKALAEQHEVFLHLDGARIFNAAIAIGCEVAEIAREANSVVFCLSKGLGAPVGSILCGDKDFIDEARYVRKLMGGGMRQVGVLAGPGLVALEDGAARLGEDHENARALARGLSRIEGVMIDLDSVQTNLVFIHLDGEERGEKELSDYLNTRGFRVYPPEGGMLRFVTSSEVNREDVDALVAAVRDYMEA